MTSKQALAEVSAMSLWLPGCYRSGGAQAYVQAGKPIPEMLLPGRLVMRASPEVREALQKLTSNEARDVPDWVVRQSI